jgi:hypothetical protein
LWVELMSGALNDPHVHEQWLEARQHLLHGLEHRLDFERTLIRDEKYRDARMVDARRTALALGLREQYAYVPRNMFLMTDNMETLEHHCLPRPVLLRTQDMWRKLPLKAYEQTPFVVRARVRAALFLVQQMAFEFDATVKWVEQVLVAAEDASDYAAFNNVPFFVLLGGQVYVRCEQHFVHASDVYHALLLWLLLATQRHNCTFDLEMVQSEQPFWSDIMDRVLEACPTNQAASDEDTHTDTDDDEEEHEELENEWVSSSSSSSDSDHVEEEALWSDPSVADSVSVREDEDERMSMGSDSSELDASWDRR